MLSTYTSLSPVGICKPTFKPAQTYIYKDKRSPFLKSFDFQKNLRENNHSAMFKGGSRLFGNIIK